MNFILVPDFEQIYWSKASSSSFFFPNYRFAGLPLLSMHGILEEWRKDWLHCILKGAYIRWKSSCSLPSIVRHTRWETAFVSYSVPSFHTKTIAFRVRQYSYACTICTCLIKHTHLMIVVLMHLGLSRRGLF